MARPTIQDMKTALQRKKRDDMLKTLKLREHFERVRLAERLRIPYRVILDNHKDGIEADEQHINRYYPKNWQTITPFWEWLEHEKPGIYAEAQNDIFNFIYDSSKATHFTDDGKPCTDDSCCSEKYKELQEEWKISQENFTTAAERRYLFARFLMGYDFSTFGEFDFFGNRGKHTQAEIEQFKEECEQLQADFEANQQNYFTDFVEYGINKNIPQPPED